jgi:hypothetical protein
MAPRPRRNAAKPTATTEPQNQDHSENEEESEGERSSRTIPAVESTEPNTRDIPATTTGMDSIPMIVEALMRAIRAEGRPPPRAPSEQAESQAPSQPDLEDHATSARSASVATVSSGKPQKFRGHGANKFKATNEREY